MVKSKKAREKGKLQLSKMFQDLKEGDKVAIVKELSQRTAFPARICGRTGIVEGKRGKAYIVKMIIGNKEKRFVINPIHLKKI